MAQNSQIPSMQKELTSTILKEKESVTNMHIPPLCIPERQKPVATL